MNPEQLALLRGIKTSLLHLMATGPLEALQPVTDAYLAVRRAEAAVPLKGTSQPTPPMHHVALEMADAAVYKAYPPPTIQRRTRADGTHEWRLNPEVWGSASDAEPQSVGFEPWEAAP